MKFQDDDPGERRMSQQFCAQWQEYALAPLFFPRLLSKLVFGGWSRNQWVHNRRVSVRRADRCCGLVALKLLHML